MKKLSILCLLLVMGILIITACSPLLWLKGFTSQPKSTPPQPTQPQAQIRDAQVVSIGIEYGKTDAAKVNAIVRGNLSDSCSTLQEPQVSFVSDTFQIKLTVSSPSDRGCIQIVSPYELKIPLDMTNLENGVYTVIANGVTVSFTYPENTVQVPASLQLVIRASNGSLQIVNIEAPLNPTARPTFNNFLPMSGSATGYAYLLDDYQNKAVFTDGKVFHDLAFVQAPAPYGLAVWAGDGQTQPRLAWATRNIGGDSSSTIKISNPDGTRFDTLLTQEAQNPPSQLVAEFWSADGQWLYFSKEPYGLGGFILFSGGSSLYKINIATKEIIDLIPTDLSQESMGCLDAVSPDLQYVAEHCSSNLIRVRNLTTGGNVVLTSPAEITTGNQLTGSARFSPDGNKLAYAVASGTQAEDMGWVVVSNIDVDNSHAILTSHKGIYFTVVGWLDDQTLLVQSNSLVDCPASCASELWTAGIDGSSLQKVADGSFLAVVPNDAFIQLPSGLP